MDDIECLENFISLYQNMANYGKIPSDSCALEAMRNDLEANLEKKLKGVHKNVICQTKDGRFKTHNPQIIKKTKLEILTALYERYFHQSPVKTRRAPTIRSLYPKWMERYEKLVEQGHRSVASVRHYRSDYTRFLEGSPLEKRDTRKITFQDIKMFYADITAGEAITRKSLNNAKTLVNQIFDYARDQDIPVVNTHDIRTMDLCCRESDNSEKVYSDEERDAILRVSARSRMTFTPGASEPCSAYA